MMGGIRVNDDGASVGGDDEGSVKHGISGLFAAGQAMGGLFGANRLGSTSLTELAVFGSGAGVTAAKNSLNNSFKVNKKLFESYINEYSSLFGQKGSIASNILRDDIQKESWKKLALSELLRA